MTLQDFSIPAVDPTQPQSAQQFVYQQEMARQLMQEGMSSAPIRSPWQGLANLGKALMGGYEMNQLRGQQRNMLASAIADNGNQLGLDPGQQDIPATPGFTSAALRQSDSINDEVSNGEDAGLSHAQALAKALAGAGGASPPQGNASLAAALGAPAAVPPSASPSGSFMPPRVAPQTGGAPLDASAFENTPAGHAAYIRYRAGQLGIDPNFATSVAGAEGLNAWSPSNPNAGSLVDRNPDGTPFSFGDFQLNVRNGLGNAARAAGIDPADPAQWQKSDDFALNYMATHGLQPWQGDKAVEAYRAGRATGAVASIPPAPSTGAGAPAPSQPNIAQLSAAMQPPAPPSTGFGLISPAGAAAGAAPVNPFVDHLSPAAAASPLAQGGNVSGPAMPSAGTPGAIPSRLAALPAPGAPMQLAGAAPSLDTATAPGAAPPAGGAGGAPSMPSPAAPPGAPPMAQFGIHPDLNAAARILANPWATPQMQQVAVELLKTQMPTQPSIVEGPVDPQTGYPSRLLFSTTRGIMGRLNADGSVTPVGSGGAPSPASPAGSGAVPPPPPGVDPKKWREEMASRTAAEAAPGASTEQDFASKVTALPSYKAYASAVPIWNSLQEIAKENSPAGDTALIEKVAHLADPDRAARRGAEAVYGDEQSGLNRFSGEVDKVLHQNAVLQPETRAQLLRVASETVQSYKQAWDEDAAQNSRIAVAHRLDPANVIPKIPDLAPLNLNAISTQKTQAGPVAGIVGQIKADPQGALAQARAKIATNPELRGTIIQHLQAAGIDPSGL